MGANEEVRRATNLFATKVVLQKTGLEVVRAHMFIADSSNNWDHDTWLGNKNAHDAGTHLWGCS